MSNSIFVILGNHLFPVKNLQVPKNTVFFMAEDLGLCTYVRHHQQKLVLFLAAMRSYRDELIDAGYQVDYQQWHDKASLFEETYEDKLLSAVERFNADQLVHYEIEDKFMEQRIAAFVAEKSLRQTVLPSPMFLCPREIFTEFLSKSKTPKMVEFYKQERVRLNILLESNGKPTGGKWSFDDENRKKLPRKMLPPIVPVIEHTAHVKTLQAKIAKRFANHPGNTEHFWLPTTTQQALDWFEQFLIQRFENFGTYEDAISTQSHTVYHSVLSPLMNLGLLTPADLVERIIEFSNTHDVPLNSTEGLVRQIIGWREFVRGIYQHFDEQQQERNHWNHKRGLCSSWYTGTTGIPPLDDTINLADRYGWTHHIPRLMIVSNLMTLCEIHPPQAYRWFMEMYVDSSDWVMGPNVFGMGLFSDGGIFATKPYICGSNYLLKMSDYKKGPWCDVVDGLYWRFVDKHVDFFSSNHRLSMMPRMLARLDSTRKTRIFNAATDFIDSNTKKLADA